MNNGSQIGDDGNGTTSTEEIKSPSPNRSIRKDGLDQN
jgi:hypothetical protein